ncbi:hypothetical protein [Thermus tenuipuniceus]|uniref:hypothetical protein n=1 Tax=Thermus tenuipuniceus TaxID=2078690 RepID=UPI000CF9AB9E|nr:hypothetical protein [Thermus tenuipuniceus]
MRKLVALMVFLAGLGLAQTTDSHTITVNIPSILSLQIDATDFLFDFSSNATGTVTVNGTPYTKASSTAYDTFIDNATGSETFAPSSVAGAGGNDFATAVVRTNRGQWTVNISSIGGTLPAPLDNTRVKVFAEKVSGKGASWTNVLTTLGAPMTLFNAGSGGQGRSVYRIYYLLEMNISDDIPSGGYNYQITINYTLTSP